MTGFTLALLVAVAPNALGWDSRQLTHPVQLEGVDIAYPEFSIFRAMGTKLQIDSQLTILQAGDEERQSAEGSNELIVPDLPGWYDFRLVNTATGEALLLHVYALQPFSQVTDEGYIGEFQIGKYPTERLRGSAIYDPPLGFIRVDEENQAIQVSPNFTVGQFLSKQAGTYPKYLVLRPALIIKLERILRALNESGHDISGIHIMSGYRTPFYNHAIGNVKYSRHQWGGAADIYIDVNPEDGQMDDLNGDGVSNKQDAIWLAGFIDDMSRAGKFSKLGGVGIYGSNPSHGPFVHVDVRGHRARW